jgi:integrase
VPARRRRSLSGVELELIRPLKTRLGVLGEIRLHDLRALYVTEALATGVDAGTVSRQAGHSTVSFTLDRNQVPRRSEARAVADAVHAALGDAIRAPSVAATTMVGRAGLEPATDGL